MSNQLATKTESSIARPVNKSMERVSNYMLSNEVKSRFSEMMGKNGIYYLNQVMILVADNEQLQKCEPSSILLAAMRAASLRLSVDPSQGQAWIIAYKNKDKNIYEAKFQPGYKGIYELAMRTNLYRFINVIQVYEGERIAENRMTGMQTIQGDRTSNKVIGRMLYFKLLHGFEKTFYMSVQQIDEHAKKYSPSYNNPKSLWHNPTERPKMEDKTVLSNGLRKWGRFNQNDLELLNQIEEEQGFNSVMDLPDEEDLTHTEKPKRGEKKVLSDLGYPEEPEKPSASMSLETAMACTNSKSQAYGLMSDEVLAKMQEELKAALKKNGLEPGAKEEMLYKSDAITIIQAGRAKK